MSTAASSTCPAVESSLPRPEYPRPQFVRTDWLCLNGEWGFEVDAGDSGLERGVRDRELSGHITVTPLKFDLTRHDALEHWKHRLG